MSSNYFCLGTIFFLAIALQFSAAALEEGESYTHYYPDFYEGRNITKSIGLLELLKFTYYGENYTMRVLSVTSTNSLVRVEKRGLELEVNGPHGFNFDSDGDDDLMVTLTHLDPPDMATFFLQLNRKPWDVPVQNSTPNITQNTTNSSSAANASSTPPQQSPVLVTSAAAANSTRNSSGSASNSSSRASSGNSTQAAPSKVSAGDVNFYITINLNVPPGSGIGLLFVIAIVLGGLVIYQKKRHRIRQALWTMGERMGDAKEALFGRRLVEESVRKKPRKRSKP